MLSDLILAQLFVLITNLLSRISYDCFPGCCIKKTACCSTQVSFSSHTEWVLSPNSCKQPLGHLKGDGGHVYARSGTIPTPNTHGTLLLSKYWDKCRQERLLQEGQSCFHWPGTAFRVCSDIILAQRFVLITNLMSKHSFFSWLPGQGTACCSTQVSSSSHSEWVF